MSASNEWWEWHLTPAGWVRGSEKLDHADTDVAPPLDRVLTVLHEEYLSSSFSKLDVSDSETFRSTDPASVSKLLNQYGYKAGVKS
jgi:hypothetical protein